MLFRAVFWIGLVALLMPHEPDLGYGRPDAIGSSLPAAATLAKDGIAETVRNPVDLCRYNATACSTGAAALEVFREAAIKGLVAVRTDIEQNGSVKLRKIGH